MARTRLTLRLTTELHRKLSAAARRRGVSLNREILDRLQRSESEPEMFERIKTLELDVKHLRTRRK